jgi:DNA-binding transcriptional LysR family regulator
MYKLRQLRTFQAVAARQSVTRAAAALGHAQSRVTAQIQALEEAQRPRLPDENGAPPLSDAWHN